MIKSLRSIELGIRIRLEDTISKFGYFPDLKLLLPLPFDEVVLNNQIQIIRDSGKSPIYVFSPGTPERQLEITDSRINIRRNYFDKGSIGFGNSIDIEKTFDDENNPANNTFRKVKHQETSFDIEYEIRFITNKSKSHRVIDEIMAASFGVRKWLNTYNEDRSKNEDGFEFEMIGTPTDLNSTDFIERMYRYSAKDIFFIEPEVISGSILAVENIELGIAAITEETNVDDLTDNDFIITNVE